MLFPEPLMDILLTTHFSVDSEEKAKQFFLYYLCLSLNFHLDLCMYTGMTLRLLRSCTKNLRSL